MDDVLLRKCSFFRFQFFGGMFCIAKIKVKKFSKSTFSPIRFSF